MNVIKRLVGRYRRPVLYLRLTGKPLIEIRSIEGFDFACESRVQLSREKLLEISQMSASQLRKEIQTISRQDELLLAVIAGYARGSNKARSHFNEIPPASFSKEHGWRDIMQSLRSAEMGWLSDQCCASALRYYQRYLTHRRDALSNVLLSKRDRERVEGVEKDVPDKEEGEGGEEAAARLDEALAVGGPHVGGCEYERLPRGQSVTLTIQPGEDMDILLSRHKCKFIIEDKELKFLSNDSREPIPIRRGRTAIGRDTVNDIVLDAAWRDVSRLHVVVDRQGDQLHITDMSSYGTFLPVHLITRHKSTLH